MKNYINYTWAVNKVKLQQATQDIINAKKFDLNAPDVSEETVKARYILRGGLVDENPIEAEEVVVPKTRRSRN